MFELLSRKIYQSSPLSIKRLCNFVPYKIIAGRHYRDTLRLCQQSEGWSRKEVIAYQNNQLKQLLQFVIDEVPFYWKYRSLISKYDPFYILKELPIISKLTIQKHFQEFIPRSINKIPHHIVRTSGSSGNQLEFFEDATTYSREMAYIHSQWKKVGYTPRCRKAMFRDITLRKQQPNIFWQLNPIHNELQFSPYHISENHLKGYVEKFIDYRPEFVHGYASAIDTFSEYILRNNLTCFLSPVRAVLLGGEACLPNQRARILHALKGKIYTFYGHSERVVSGGECEYSQFYHFFPSYGIVEVIADDGSICQIGEEGEIVGTGFLNRSMPLIRYRTDDYAILQEPYCKCGRFWDRVSDLRSRRSIEGYVIGKTGTKITSAALETPSDAFHKVIRLQYFQNKPGELRIRVLPNPMFSTDDEMKIIDAHKKRMWGEMDIVIDLVKDIPLTARGKQRLIISEMRTDE